MQTSKPLEHLPPDSSIFTIPNALTATRILAIPWVIYLMYSPKTHWDHFWAAGLFGLALWTDYFDGLLARKMKKITKLGKIMDPMADKLMIVTALLMLVHLNFVNVVIVILLIGREVAINALRTLAATEGIFIAPSMTGRLKVFGEGFGIGFLLLGPDNQWLGMPWMEIGNVCLYIGLILALWSGFVYCRDYLLQQKTSNSKP